MQHHWNYTICISWLIPRGCLQLARGDKHKPDSERWGGGREGPSGSGASTDPQERPGGTLQRSWGLAVARPPAAGELPPQSHALRHSIAEPPACWALGGGHWEGVGVWVLRTCHREASGAAGGQTGVPAQGLSPQRTLHSPIRNHLEITTSKIKWVRLLSQNGRTLNPEFRALHALDVGLVLN